MTNIFKSIIGRQIGLANKNGLVIENPHTGQGIQVASSLHPGTPISQNIVFDDFTCAVLDVGKWVPEKGSDGGAVYPVIATANGGTIALATSGAGTSSMAVSGCQILGALNWVATNGNLVMEARVKLAAITASALYVGFTDSVALEMPINSAGSANTLTTTASDAVGFVFDTTNTAQTYVLAGVAADVDTTVQVLTNAPVANTYDTLRVEIDTAGAATFYINGVNVGTKMTGAVTPGTALVPTVAIFERGAAVKTATVDYILTAQNRV